MLELVRRKSRKGSVILELALTLPLFMLLLGGTLDFSRIFYLGMAVANAARAGVQYGIQSPSNYTNYTGMQNAAIASEPDVSGITATASQYCESNGAAATCGGSGQDVYIKVSASADYKLMCTYLFLPDNITVSNSAVMRIQ